MWREWASPAAISAEEQMSPSRDEVDLSVAHKNATLMDAIFQSQPNAQSETVIVLKYSRNPECFHILLETDPQLQDCRLQLKNHGLPFRLLSGAYLFVQPGQHGDVLEYIAEHNLSLGP